MRSLICLMLLVMLHYGIAVSAAVYGQPSSSSQELTLVVMDPLCDRLACDCVEGYAQRKYEILGEFLQQRLGRKVSVFWGESVGAALEEERQKTADIVIGKHSVVNNEAQAKAWTMRPLAQLTGGDGSVTQTGLIVVRKNDPATRIADLKDYRIFFGPDDCDEKYRAPMTLLKEHGVAIPEKPEISGACSEAATKLLDLDDDIRAAAVISSYAEPLLAGCGTIEKGDLRVLGVSDEVPFVTAFVSDKLPKDLQMEIKAALLATGKASHVKDALQSNAGFIAFQGGSSSEKSASSHVGQQDGNTGENAKIKKN